MKLYCDTDSGNVRCGGQREYVEFRDIRVTFRVLLLLISL